MGEWHNILVSRTSRLISMRINNRAPSVALTPGAFTQVNPNNSYNIYFLRFFISCIECLLIEFEINMHVHSQLTSTQTMKYGPLDKNVMRCFSAIPSP